MYELYTVLFVDDEINILNALKRGMIDEEYKCLFVESGMRALEIMENTRVAVVVSDIRMSGMDGITLLSKIKEKWPQTVRVVLSGQAQLQDILSTINQADIFKFLTKPWKFEEELRNVINAALDYYILQEENAEYKRSLQKKNLAYQNILKNLDMIIESAKRNSLVLSTCGKSLLSFIRKHENIRNEKMSILFESIYDNFSKDAVEDEREYDKDAFVIQITELLKSRIKNVKISINSGADAKIIIVFGVLKAVFLSCIDAFSEEFNDFGMDISIKMANTNKFAITINSSSIVLINKGISMEEYSLFELKSSLLTKVLGSVLATNKMSFSMTSFNETFIIAITVN
jgi:CheY-like chemotaxis protein